MDRGAILSMLRERIIGYAASRIGRDSAEDLAQDVLILLEEKYPQVDGIADLLPLSLQIARFKLAAIYRKSARHGENSQVSVDEIQIPDLSQDTADEYERREMMGRLAAAINQLPPRCREMIRWKLAGHSFGEIQKLLKLDSINTVYSQDFRCRKQLMELMGENFIPGAKDAKVKPSDGKKQEARS
ncbi:MAG TPA: RNA polymerase sigma factor [Bryobacteraceae bacterium]